MQNAVAIDGFLTSSSVCVDNGDDHVWLQRFHHHLPSMIISYWDFFLI